MTVKKNLTRFLMVAVIAALGLLTLAACGGAKYTVTWDVSEHATVSVSGFDALPDEIEEETNLSFTIVAKTGYEITAVSINEKTVTADVDGNYSTVAKSDIKIKVETVAKLISVNVKANPDKLSYSEGEQVDITGMVVEAEYGSGEKIAVTDYTIIYPNGDVFAVGDTYFKVLYQGLESETVTLNDAVTANSEDSVFVIAGWGRFITEDVFSKYVDGFKDYCDANNIKYTSISGTYYPGKTNGTDPYFAIKNFTTKVVEDGNVDVIVACADNIGGANANNDSQVKDIVVEKKSIDIKGQTGRMVATLNTCDLNKAFLAYVETDAAKAILAE